MHITNIKDVVIAVTYRCNARCRMCNIWRNNNFVNEMKTGDFLKLPKNLEDINITGGEPFLRKDLTEIIAIIKKHCPRANIVISTNGISTNVIVKAVKKILDINSDIGIAVSIDGMERQHDAIRGVPGAYKKAIKTLNELKKIGVKNLKIAFTLGDYNVGELRYVYHLAQKMDAEFSLAAVHSSDNYFAKEHKIINKNGLIREIDWIMRQELSKWKYKNWARAYFAYGLREFIRTGRRILPDYSGHRNIFISPSGDIYPNNISNIKIGKLNNKELLEVKSIPASWMMCTARQTKRHWLKAGWWLLKNKRGWNKTSQPLKLF